VTGRKKKKKRLVIITCTRSAPSQQIMSCQRFLVT